MVKTCCKEIHLGLDCQTIFLRWKAPTNARNHEFTPSFARMAKENNRFHRLCLCSVQRPNYATDLTRIRFLKPKLHYFANSILKCEFSMLRPSSNVGRFGQKLLETPNEQQTTQPFDNSHLANRTLTWLTPSKTIP